MRRAPVVTRVLALSLFVATAGVACQKSQPPAPPAAPAAAAPAAPTPPPAAAPAGTVQVTITDEGFVPARIPAKVGQPLTLAITRKAERTCATEILFAGQEGKTDLPLNKTVQVTYTPKASGEIKFGCAMGMMIGGVVVATN